jgi:hypothetical protein
MGWQGDNLRHFGAFNGVLNGACDREKMLSVLKQEEIGTKANARKDSLLSISESPRV